MCDIELYDSTTLYIDLASRSTTSGRRRARDAVTRARTKTRTKTAKTLPVTLGFRAFPSQNCPKCSLLSAKRWLNPGQSCSSYASQFSQSEAR